MDSKAKEYKMIETGFGNHSFVALTTSGDIYCLAASPTKYPCVISVSLKTGKVFLKIDSTVKWMNLFYNNNLSSPLSSPIHVLSLYLYCIHHLVTPSCYIILLHHFSQATILI